MDALDNTMTMIVLCGVDGILLLILVLLLLAIGLIFLFRDIIFRSYHK